MLGPAKVRRVDQPALASLGALVPAHHFYRQLGAKLDLTYATVENIRAIEDAGIRAYVPLADWDRTACYGPSRFSYDAVRDEYRCP